LTAGIGALWFKEYPTRRRQRTLAIIGDWFPGLPLQLRCIQSTIVDSLRQVSMTVRRRQRQLENEFGTALHTVLRAQPAAVLLDDAVADRQPEARALAHRLGREERFEDAQQVLGQDARAVVAQAQAHLRVVALQREPELRVARARPSGRIDDVLQQVHQHLLQLPCTADHDARRAAPPVHLEAGAGALAHPIDRAFDDFVQVAARVLSSVCSVLSPLNARSRMAGQVMQLPPALQRPGQSKGPRRPRYRH